ncbi:hypothetical protein [Nonomuraea recticatena]|uniref:hypothetical protein n=1 Tax=Nonomuraea recticatena TaxID=46178 RepID=UPI00361CCE7B
MPRLAIAPDFPRELSALAPPARGEVMAALPALLSHVPAPEGVGTLRMAEGHLAVVVRQGEVSWLLTLLPDAEAEAYARRHAFSVNPVIGVVEQWDAEALGRVEHALRRSAGQARLFEPVSDTDLLSLGIDLALLPLIRLIGNEADVEALEALLPPTQYLPLSVMARGGSLPEAWRSSTPAAPRGTLPSRSTPPTCTRRCSEAPTGRCSPPRTTSWTASSPRRTGASSCTLRSTGWRAPTTTSTRCSSRAAPAPARPSSRCTGPPTWPGTATGPSCW